MKNLKNLSFVIIATLSFSAYAYDKKQGYYGGIGVARTTIAKTNYNEANIKIISGIKINNNLSIEGNFLRLQNADTENTYNNKSVSGYIFGVSGLYHINNWERITPFIKLGFYKSIVKEVEKYNHNTLSKTTAINDSNLFFGVGVDIPNDVFTTRVEWENYTFSGNKIDKDIKAISVSAIFNF